MKIISLDQSTGADDEKRRLRLARRWKCLTEGCVYHSKRILLGRRLNRKKKGCPRCPKCLGKVAWHPLQERPLTSGVEKRFFCSTERCAHNDHFNPAKVWVQNASDTGSQLKCPVCKKRSLTPETEEGLPQSYSTRRTQTA